MDRDKPASPPIYSIATLSASGLAYEVLLVRLFSIIQWHHFAYMVISLALLGYAVSGTFLALFRERLLKNFHRFFLVNAVAFGLISLLCYLIAQSIPFHPEEMLWNWRQALRLPVVYLILGVPFFFVANATGLTFSRFPENASRVYAADLLGAGVGCLGIIGLLSWVHPSNALRIISVAGFLSSGIAWQEFKLKSKILPAGIVISFAALFFLPTSWVALTISQYKGLPQMLNIPGTRILQEKSSPLALLSVVESPQIPLRSAPGLSINARTEPPPQLAVFQDADSMTAITHYTGDSNQLAYLDEVTSALPYHLKPVHNLLALGAGGGSDLLQARFHGVREIDAVELNPQMVALLQKDYATYAGHIYNAPGTRIYIDEARGFVRTHSKKYDLIHLWVPGGFGASSAGLFALNENYLFTIEAFEDYIKRLNPDGMLAITAWVQVPPRDTLKLFATAVQALKRSNMPGLERRLILIRSWQTGTLLVKNGSFTGEELVRLREFCAARSFDVAYYPGMKAEEANIYNLLPQPTLFFDAARALLSDQPEKFQHRYKFNIQPATDQRPYFYHFFKWSILPEIVGLYGQGGVLLLESGYLVLIASMIQAVALSSILILLPLLLQRRTRPKLRQNQQSPWRALSYFFLLGLAFLFVEIAMIQKFMLFLYQPIYAVSITIAAFLIFAGLGSAYSKKMQIRCGGTKTVRIAVLLITVLAVLYIGAASRIFSWLSAASFGLRIFVAAVFLAPIGFFMGMPFPQGLFALKDRSESVIPWAWGVNGAASVLSAILATMIAVQFGFNILLFFAVVLYGFALLVFPGQRTPHPRDGETV